VNAQPDRPFVFVNYTDETFTPTSSGALATYIFECCRAAAASGEQPWVISRAAAQPPFDWPRLRLLDYPRRPGGRLGTQLTRVQRNAIGLPKLGQRAWAGRVARAVRELAGPRCTLLLQNDPEVCVYLRAALPDARIVLLFQNQLPAREPFRSRLAGSVDAIAAVSDFTADWVAEHYGLPRERVTTVYSGVAADEIRPPAERSGVPVIGFVGRTGIEKAPDVLLKAALALADRTTQFGVQVVGSNHWDRFEEDDYQRTLAALGAQLTSRGIEVTRPGHVGRKELPRWLQRSAIHVVPSRWDEPFGLTTLEGMAAGNAVVASRTGGTPEVVGAAGQLFERDDVAGLTELLYRLVVEPEVRAEWARRARARAESLTWARTYEQLRALGTGAR
jgi:glycosyltransferase involved in cell wall biosynthesis